METKSKYLLIFVFFVTFFSLGYTYYHTLILQDFEVIDTSEPEDVLIYE